MEYNIEMEVPSKQQYFNYYAFKGTNNSTHERSRQHKLKYEPLKLLPHISEEYNYRITNHLLIKKIISPKRDKTIMQSLESVFKRIAANRSHCGSRDKQRKMHQSHSAHQLKQTRSTANLRNRGAPNENNPKDRAGKNVSNRTGIINRCHTTLHKSQTPSILENQIHNEIPKQQNLSNIPLSRSLNRGKQSRDIDLLQGLSFSSPPGGYGWGSTVLKLTHFLIEVNPPIRDDALLQLQLVERPSVIREYESLIDTSKEKAIKTNPFKYSQLPQHPLDSAIKFCLRVAKIGDFIPLRIWKYIGVECVLVGTVDIPLLTYSEADGQNKEQKEIIQYKKDHPNKSRKVIFGQVQRYLLNTKMIQTQAKVHIKYQVYPKKYNKQSIKIHPPY